MITLGIKRTPLKRNLLKNILFSTSTEPVLKNTDEEYEKQLKQFETLTNITKKTRPKKPQRPPFVKNLLVGSFDTQIFEFPQLEKDEVNNLEKECQKLEALLKQNHMVNVDCISNKNFRQNLADYRAIGLQASQFLDGRESTLLEVMKYLETFSVHKLGQSLIHNEQLTLQTLVKFASDELKKKYLCPSIKGEKLGAFCLTEKELCSVDNMETQATLSHDEKSWILNGTKSRVVNGVSADYLVVVAVTNIKRIDNEIELKFTTFLVDKDLPGVSWEKIEPCDIEIAEITFKDTKVPVENIIGQVHQGEALLTSILNDFRLSCGPACITLTRKMLNKLQESIIKDSLLHKTEAVQSKLGEIAANLYAMESVTYLTAGLRDWYENQDCAIESAIVKVFSSEKAYDTSTMCLDMLGFEAALKNHWAHTLHQQCLNYLTIHETNDSQRMFIALSGLQHTGLETSEKIKKLRNFWFHATYVMSRMFTQSGNINDNPKLDLELWHYLHPSLRDSALELEYCVKRLEWGAEKILARHGVETPNKHLDLRRLADSMIDAYAMTAVLARASRSYCIGLQHSSYELVLANAFCLNAKRRVQQNVLNLYISEYLRHDKYFVTTGKQVIKNREYFPKNPLTRNF